MFQLGDNFMVTSLLHVLSKDSDNISDKMWTISNLNLLGNNTHAYIVELNAQNDANYHMVYTHCTCLFWN